ncbi:hypothetical protein BJX61DRAFT_494206 [Aspergillus egyptiacus]|nr:hypothetical protein BJX61DRAFT_494206 [Aspergillus egyptiacus]
MDTWRRGLARRGKGLQSVPGFSSQSCRCHFVYTWFPLGLFTLQLEIGRWETGDGWETALRRQREKSPPTAVVQGTQ